MYAETNGSYDCSRSGQSGEIAGCVQYLPETFRHHALATLGYVPPATAKNQEYIAMAYYSLLLEQGYSTKDIALIHNQGHTGACSSGVNRHGVAYDSCAYAERVVLAYHKIKNTTN